ncbi:MAG: aldehyde dehydrogenase family protein [Rickettsiales bacterium]|jgi:aldehyde dehydrogenase (NAD+)|nr:aldehyde dehydrogenase family protein [Rickettsiales bacterium]
MNNHDLLKHFGISSVIAKGDLDVFTPIDGSLIAKLKKDDKRAYNIKVKSLSEQFTFWRNVPAPKRGELIRLFGEKLRAEKEYLAKMITLECGKILSEARGEVQEMIDICDFAVGLSRQLYGLDIASERFEHKMQESYRPLGVVGVISAFNFPAAVWAWNFALAIICGNTVLWKPSEITPLVALASQSIFNQACSDYKHIYKNADKLSEIIISDKELGDAMVRDKKIALVSATGSCQMGKIIAPILAKRFAKSIFELGGNNAVIVSDKANLQLALDAIVFGAVGTCGQRCTTTRRVFVQETIYLSFLDKLKMQYAKLNEQVIGDPFNEKKLIGPLINKSSYLAMVNAIEKIKISGVNVLYGQRLFANKYNNAYYVQPALVGLNKQIPIMQEETFAPLLYVAPYKTLDDAMVMHNDVEQGLSSSIFTTNIAEAEFFRNHSDCGIVNVNIGTSGAEIGGAFGGEKTTGGGRESGSDCWKNYMRRQTSTTYYGIKTPELAQNVKFG